MAVSPVAEIEQEENAAESDTDASVQENAAESSKDASVQENPAESTDKAEKTDTSATPETGAATETPVTESTPSTENSSAAENAPATGTVTENTPETEKAESAPAVTEPDISGSVTVEDTEISGTVKLEVEADKNDDNVEIKEKDKPYLALGADLTAEQQAVVLSLMGIDPAKLGEYDVLYVNNEEEHKYLDAYIDSSKIGTRSLSSIVIVEREDGNGINISTNNISYCTVGMYKNALATAGIENADIIVAGPTAISGTAALVGIFKAYTEMTGKEIGEENIDAALNELVLTGALESSTGAEADEIEAMIAYVKQAVVEHDMTDEKEIREAIEEGCKEFGVTLSEEDMQEIVKLMLKISELDLDLDSLLNSAQSIYDKIKTADSGFWAKVRELLDAIVEAVKNIFS
ncbi:MAG: DUF1002 domain-containing protein [Lachnospiraceae bacterium]|nr:DUF1002 domain-containing protein [Lachnospiraceae bacterium]